MEGPKLLKTLEARAVIGSVALPELSRPITGAIPRIPIPRPLWSSPLPMKLPSLANPAAAPLLLAALSDQHLGYPRLRRTATGRRDAA